MEHREVVIVGGGISGIGAAIRLRQERMTDFVLLEKANALGGTWRDNTYPGCACDVPSALYSYSFAPNPDWTRGFAGQAEILAYIQSVATRYHVLDHVRFGVELKRATWDARARRWNLDTTRGPISARVVVAGAGPWHEPLVPDLPGLSAFEGTVFHSSRWNHEYELTGKRVAVVGTGASAVQFVPKIQSKVSSLHLFQRTAQWVLPKPDRKVPAIARRAMRAFPQSQSALRAAEYAAMEAFGVGFRRPWILEQIQRMGLRNLHAAIKEPSLRARLTPSYTLGCKRLLMSNTYYPSLARSNVAVHATAVREIRKSTIVGADGAEATVDAIIFGTGFRILDMPLASRLVDANGRTMAAHWKGSPQAYLGTTVSGFPNLFLLLGPSLGTGHSSAFSILEAQLAYVIAALRTMRRGGLATIDTRPEVQMAFNADVQEALRSTVYNAGGCKSYYMDANGRNSFSWPWSTTAMRERIGDFDPDAYVATRLLGARALASEETA
jgi:cyclohexanone monooxygenase